MKVFAISDLHLSTTAPKPMNVFGPVWTDHAEKIMADWEKKVTDDDIVLIAGDLSWAMQLDDAIKDLSTFAHLKGKKILEEIEKDSGVVNLIILKRCHAHRKSRSDGYARLDGRGRERVFGRRQKALFARNRTASALHERR